MNEKSSLPSCTGLVMEKILIITTNADLAGAPSHVCDLVEGIRGRVGDLVVVFGEDGPSRTRLEGRGIQTHVIPTMRSNLNFAQDAVSVRQLCALLDLVRPSLVHAHSSKAGLVARIACKIKKVPVVYTVHGWGFGKGRRRLVSFVVRKVEACMKRWTSQFIAVSEADRQIGITELGIPPKSIATVHNGIPDTHERATPDKSEAIIMVARTGHQKDHETFFKAVAHLQVQVICVGSGTDGPALQALARRVGLSPDRLRLLGMRKDIPEVLAGCGVFVLASRFEGLPLSIIEAMRAGLPVIASDVGGVAELVEHGASGYLVEAGNPHDLNHHLSLLLNDPALRLRFGERGRGIYDARLTREAMVERTLSTYAEVLSRNQKET
jgi:glycosyltransferase involved in cell wall biosynthesis